MIKELTKEKHLKYILNDLQDYANEKFVSPLKLADSECELLLNYITNLQKENEKLKEENKHIFSRVNDDELLINNAMNYAELQDYKQRNEKAVEFIKEWWYEKNTRDINRIVSLGDKRIDLYNILQGGDEE